MGRLHMLHTPLLITLHPKYGAPYSDDLALSRAERGTRYLQFRRLHFCEPGGDQTIVNLTEDDSSYVASLIIGIERNG